jgi:predicted 3'-5' exonuclease similar to PolB exonuclease domain
MLELRGRNIVVLDVETLRSAQDCRECFQSQNAHQSISSHDFAPIGWEDHDALGLSIGCYWDYAIDRIVWFDIPSLPSCLETLLVRNPMLVTFNGLEFDCLLLQAVCEGSDDLLADWRQYYLRESYDLLDEIWRIDPDRKFAPGLNSLDAIAQATGLGSKLGHGAQAPRDWQEGQIAKVLNYCADDVYKTKALFEMVCAGQPLYRGDGQPIWLPNPFSPPATDPRPCRHCGAPEAAHATTTLGARGCELEPCASLSYHYEPVDVLPRLKSRDSSE